MHTFNSGDVLTASDMMNNLVQRAGSGTPAYKILAGTTAYSLSSASAVNVTADYSAASFSAIIAVILTVQSGSSIDLIADLNGAPGTSSASVRIVQKDGANTTISSNLHWLAIGT